MWFKYYKGYYDVRKLELELVQRLADYERYLGQEARSLIDSECIDSGSVLHRGQLEGDLHRIQELFPGDNLRLHERDVVTTKTKNMLRKRNGSTPVRLTRGLSQKTLDTTDSTSSPTKSPTRTFLLETPVQFTTVRKASGSDEN